jgi:guanylate kinase
MVESKHQWKAWLYLAPAIALLLVFTVWPIINTVRMAFLEGYSGLKASAGAHFALGFGNFTKVMAYKKFTTTLYNTLLLCVLTVPLSTLLALLIAVALNSIKPMQKALKEPTIIVLVGPSGSRKNDIARSLVKENSKLERLPSYTTVEQLDVFSMERYQYVSEEEFLEMHQRGELFESTNYANHFYGSRKADVEEILQRGNYPVTVMDICGAMSMKTHFNNVVTIYVKRDRYDLLTDILEKEIDTHEKVNRLLSLEYESKNAEVCDYVVDYTTCEEAVRQITDTLGLA